MGIWVNFKSWYLLREHNLEIFYRRRKKSYRRVLMLLTFELGYYNAYFGV